MGLPLQFSCPLSSVPVFPFHFRISKKNRITISIPHIDLIRYLSYITANAIYRSNYDII